MTFTLRLLRVTATVLAFGSLTACFSKSDNATPATTTSGGMSWTIDANNVTATTAAAQSSGPNVMLAGATGTTGGVFLDEVPKAPGTYFFSNNSNASASYVVTPTQGADQIYEATSGSIVVTNVSATNIIGTFSFTGTLSGSTATKTLTNGKFNVAF